MPTFRNASATPRHTPHGGNAYEEVDSVTPTGGAAADIYRFGPFPAGLQVGDIAIKNADLDSNGAPTLAIKGGYSFVDGSAAPAGADQAFIATGSAILQSASPVGGNRFLVKPVEIQKDWFLDLVVTNVAATFASGEITAFVRGKAVGAK